jgi:hypothetical protein
MKKNKSYYYFSSTKRGRIESHSIKIFEDEKSLIEYALTHIKTQLSNMDEREQKYYINRNFTYAFRGIMGGHIDENGFSKLKDFYLKLKLLL